MANTEQRLSDIFPVLDDVIVGDASSVSKSNASEEADHGVETRRVSARESLAVNGTEAPSHNGAASITDSAALGNSVLSASKQSSGDPHNAGKAAAMDVGRHPDDPALAPRSMSLIESRLSDLERRIDAHTRRTDDHFDRLNGHLCRVHMQMTVMQHSFMKDIQAMLQQVFDEVVTLREEIAKLRDDA